MPSDAANGSQTGLSTQQHYQAGQLLHRQGRLEEAERHFRAVLQVHPDHVGTLQRLGALCFQSGRLDEAAGFFGRTAAAAPEDAMARNNLGFVLHSLGRSEEALVHFKKAIALKPDFAETHTNLGNALVALNRPEEALASYATTIALNPRLPEPYNNIGNVLSSLGRHEEAVAQFEKALALKPDFASAFNNLGNSLGALGRREEAIAEFERALSLQPGVAAARYNLGTTLAELGRHEEAVVQFEKALASRPDYAAAANNLGNSLNALDRPVEALAAFEKALAVDPGHAAAHFGAGSALQSLGRLADSRAAFERALVLAPKVPTYHRAVADTKRFREGDRQIAALEELARDMPSFAENERIELHFALAKAYADLERHGPAFAHLQSGNALKRRSVAYDETAELDGLRAIAAAFTRELMDSGRGSGDQSAAPIFIVGMPRSGTSLVEQMLASHPSVFGAGELTYLGDIVAGGYGCTSLPFDVSMLSGEQLRRFGARYVERVRSLAPQAERITDKLPANFRFTGLIHLMLPKARIIHVRRDPVDTCFSCYSKLFTHGLDYAYDLGELGRYYRAYEALMEHWRSVLPEDAMLEVQYEDLVADFEAQARRILAYCGLEWDERCLSFHRTERTVRTASAVQVRQPLYKSSVGRWRSYREQLRPLLDALERDLANAGGSP